MSPTVAPGRPGRPDRSPSPPALGWGAAARKSPMSMDLASASAAAVAAVLGEAPVGTSDDRVAMLAASDAVGHTSPTSARGRAASPRLSPGSARGGSPEPASWRRSSPSASAPAPGPSPGPAPASAPSRPNPKSAGSLRRQQHLVQLVKATAALGADGVPVASLRASELCVRQLRGSVQEVAEAASEARGEMTKARFDASSSVQTLQHLLGRAELARSDARAQTKEVESAVAEVMSGLASRVAREAEAAAADARGELERELSAQRRARADAQAAEEASLEQSRKEAARAAQVENEFESLRAAVVAQRNAQAAEVSQLESRIRELEAGLRMSGGLRRESALKEAEERARARAQAAAARAAEAMVQRQQSTNSRMVRAATEEADRAAEAALAEAEAAARRTLQERLQQLELARERSATEAARLREAREALDVQARALAMFDRRKLKAESRSAEFQQLKGAVRSLWDRRRVALERRRMAMEGMLWTWGCNDALCDRLRVMSARLEERRKRRELKSAPASSKAAAAGRRPHESPSPASSAPRPRHRSVSPMPLVDWTPGVDGHAAVSPAARSWSRPASSLSNQRS